MTNPEVFDIKLVTIDRINIINTGIINKTELLALEKGKHYVDLKHSFVPGVNWAMKKFRLLFNCVIHVHTEDKKAIDIRGTFDIAFLFDVKNLEQVAKKEAKQLFTLDGAFITSMANIVYATSRGIVYTRCQGTIFQEVILPIMPSKDLFELLLKDAHNQTTPKKPTTKARR